MAGKASRVAAHFKKRNTKMLYTHCQGHALNLAVENASFEVNMLKVTFEMTREICKLVKESQQRNNVLQEIRKTTKNQSKVYIAFAQQDGQCVVKRLLIIMINLCLFFSF